MTHLLPGGWYQVNAHYAGDGTYAGSDSTPPVWITIKPEPTTLTFSVLTKDAGGNFIPFTGGPYGTPVYYQAHVTGQSGYGTPSNWVNFWDTNGASEGYNWLDAKGNALTPPLTQIQAGSHSITAGYYGDLSFNLSDDLTPINFTITNIATNTVLVSQQTPQSFLLAATVSASGVGSPATGTVTFSSGGTTLGTASLINGSTSNSITQATATLDATHLTPGQYNVTASYPGDPNYTASSSALMPLNLVADFTIANRGFTTQTVTAGRTASYINDIGVNPFFGFSGTVAVSCTVPAQATTCSVTPNSYSLASGAGWGTLAVTTTPRSSAALRSPADRIPLRPRIFSYSVMALLLCVTLVPSSQSRKSRFRRRLAFSILLFAVLAAGIVACGGGSTGGGGGPPPSTGTLAGTYTITVTATSGTLTHTTTLTLIVQ